MFCSTAAVYGVPDASPIPEDAPLRPINPYGETKRTFEAALDFYGAAYGLRSMSLRYFNVAGATERTARTTTRRRTSSRTSSARPRAGRPLTLFGDDYPTPDGTCVRDYIHVEDLADAHLAALEATAPGDRGPTGRSPEPRHRRGFSVREVLAAAEASSGDRSRHGRAARAGDPPVLVAARDRAASVLGWRPAPPSLDEMIGSAWAWRQGHPEGYPD